MRSSQLLLQTIHFFLMFSLHTHECIYSTQLIHTQCCTQRMLVPITFVFSSMCCKSMRWYRSRLADSYNTSLNVDTTTFPVHCKDILAFTTYWFLNKLTTQTSVIILQVHDLLWNSLQFAATLQADEKLGDMAGGCLAKYPSLFLLFTGEAPRAGFLWQTHAVRHIHVDGGRDFVVYKWSENKDRNHTMPTDQLTRFKTT